MCERDGQFVSLPQALLIDEPAGTAVRLKLAVYTSEATRHEGQPVHRAIVRQLGPTGLEVATVQGIWGFHAEHAPHGDRFPGRGRHVPAVTTVIGTPEQVSAAFDIVGALTAERGLVTAQTVLAAQPAAETSTVPVSLEEAEGPAVNRARANGPYRPPRPAASPPARPRANTRYLTQAWPTRRTPMTMPPMSQFLAARASPCSSVSVQNQAALTLYDRYGLQPWVHPSIGQ